MFPHTPAQGFLLPLGNLALTVSNRDYLAYEPILTYVKRTICPAFLLPSLLHASPHHQPLTISAQLWSPLVDPAYAVALSGQAQMELPERNPYSD